MDNLKHCPFCGSEARLVEKELPEGTHYQIVCTGKDCPIFMCETMLYADKDEVIDAWNIRNGEDS